MGICRVCFRNINQFSWQDAFSKNIYLCSKCFSEMHPSFAKIMVDNTKIYTCYEYHEKIRSLLYQFKGCYDFALSPIFLSHQSFLLSLLFHGYIVVPAPSTEESDVTRGFNHVEEMFRPLALPIEKLFRKTSAEKQSDLHLEERKKVRSRLAIVGRVYPKKYLIVDDVTTTGSTILAMKSMLEEAGAKKVKCLAMARVEKKNNYEREKLPR